MTTITLTDLERTALADLWASSKGNGHDFGYPDELPSVPRSQRGGVVASLSKKGLVVVYDNSDDGFANQFEFTHEGRELFVDFSESGILR